ncbi:MAG: hypothetical protein ACREXW_10975 [Gammaproteobacteria bacterium]
MTLEIEGIDRMYLNVYVPQLQREGGVASFFRFHRYEPTTLGLRVALFFSRTYARLLRPILADIAPSAPPGHSPIRAAFERLQTLIDQACQEAQLATG